MISDKEIDQALMVYITDQWRKVARVVGSAMGDIPQEKRAGRNDLYFAGRVAFLAVTEVIEYDGDLGQMGRCEVRRRQTASDDA